jgi:hypothetical protein
MPMKRMLIIGSEYPGIKSITWAEVTTINITDYQIVLADFNQFTAPAEPGGTLFVESIYLLITNGHPVIFLLPRKSSHALDSFFLWNIDIQSKSGVTLIFQDNDEIIKHYKPFVTKHEIILEQANKGHAFFPNLPQRFLRTDLIWNNVNQTCGFKLHTLYLLHSPDIKLYKKAIEGLVNYFSPDVEYVSEEKPDWAKEYESKELALHVYDEQITNIQLEIDQLTERKTKIINERDGVAKWSDLITLQGKLLETRLKEAFYFLGVQKVDHEPSGTHGPDLGIHHKSLEFIAEIEGSKGPIRIDKARELLHWIADVPPDHKGILLGNPFRELPPFERPPANNRLFVKEAEELAQKRDFVLINTYEIFKLISRKLKGEKLDIDEILNRLYHSRGETSLS